MENLQIKDTFKKTGIRYSQKKAMLFSKILKLENSFDAISLYENIKNELEVDRATIYRTITQFKEKKLIREVSNIDGKQFYESSLSKTHPHFICDSCKDIQCLKETSLNLSLDLEKKSIRSISIDINGLCENCQ